MTGAKEISAGEAPNQLKFNVIKALLYGRIDWKQTVEWLRKQSEGMGVCAKVFKKGEVAWRCEDCELDPTCIMCQSCYEKSDHTGHRVWLKTNVSGCCDCGDPDGYKEEGFCSDHKGFAASSETMIASLPPYLKESSPRAFSALMNVLKGVLLKSSDPKTKEKTDTIIGQIYTFIEQMLAECPSNIYFISRAITDIQTTDHDLIHYPEHVCCHRYFISEELSAEFHEKRQKEAMANRESKGTKYCTCSVLDLMCQNDNHLAKSNKKMSQNICYTMFQSYEFKYNLGFAYMANIDHLYKHRYDQDDTRGIISLGVQILTIDDIALAILKDPMLRYKLIETVARMIDGFKGQHEETISTWQQLMSFHTLIQDIKYMAKPKVIPVVLRETDFLEKMLGLLSSFCLNDIFQQSTKMDLHEEIVVTTVQIENEKVICAKTRKFLIYANQDMDVQAKVMKTFRGLMHGIDQEVQSKIFAFGRDEPKGFFFIPLHRSLATFLGRMIVNECICDEKFKTGVENPDSIQQNIFYAALKKHMPDAVLLRMFVEQTMRTLSHQQGFMAEVRAKKWIYKGERLQKLPRIETSEFEHYFLPQIALFQLLICCSHKPSHTVTQMVQNFGTDTWLSTFDTNLQLAFKEAVITTGEDKGASFHKVVVPLTKVTFEECMNFDVEKLSLHLQQLMLKLIHIGIFETPILAQCTKNLFTRSEENQKQEIEEKDKYEIFQKLMLKNLEREVFHNLFMHGANTSISAIKKSTPGVFVKDEHFEETIVRITTSQTDASGQKKFRLKDQKPLFSMYDPYFYIDEADQQQQQASYSSLYKEKEGLNEYVGDFEGNYQYQTSINRTVRQAIASSLPTVTMLVSLLRFACDVAAAKEQPERDVAVSDFEKKLFPMKSLFMSLKLVIWIAQANKDFAKAPVTELLKQRLPRSLLKSACNSDKKLAQIGEYLSELIHGGQNAEEKPQEVKVEISANDKREAMKKKQAAIKARMSKKQSLILQKKAEVKVEEKEEVDQADVTCASCQETIEIGKFNGRPFVQLGLAVPNKVLYHSFTQTYTRQKQALRNERRLNKGQKEEEEQVSAFETKEEVQMIDTEEKDTLSKNYEQAMNLDLSGLVHGISNTGASVSKCCHFFHVDCLQEYLTAEQTQSYEKRYMRKMIGLDNDAIQCPICKGLSNIHQPYFPLMPTRANQVQQVEGEKFNLAANTAQSMEPYCRYLCQLRKAHLGQAAGDKELLLTDIQKNPVEFCESMQSLVAHSLLVLGAVKPQSGLLVQHDPTVNQDELTLRDLTYILQTLRALLQRLWVQSINLFGNASMPSPKQIGEQILEKMAQNVERSPFERNFSKLVVQLLFALSLVLPFDEDSQELSRDLSQVVVEAVYSVLKAQSLMAQNFRDHFGECKKEEVLKGFEAQQAKAVDCEELISSQLQFLRVASATVMCFRALTTDTAFTFGCHLGLDVPLMQQLASQVDDKSEFELLTAYLMLRPETIPLFDSRLDTCHMLTEDSVQNIRECIGLDIEQSAALNLFVENMKTEEIPDNLLMLTPFYSFGLVDLPNDFTTFQQQYYAKKCKNCNQQVQVNALCLLCGDIVCLQRKDNCCQGLPGMITFQHQQGNNFFDFNAQTRHEGELSYHARMVEGGCAAFIVPSTAEIYLVDGGRICRRESFYRNALGEAFKKDRTRKWDKFEISEETGGKQSMIQLRKAYLDNKIPNLIVQGRQQKDSVIIRHIL